MTLTIITKLVPPNDTEAPNTPLKKNGMTMRLNVNVYIDDRGGLPSVYRMLDKLITKIENGEIVYE